jgi:hypothetical protein
VLQVEQMKTRGSLPKRGNTFLHSVQTGTLADAASYAMGIGGFFLGPRWPELACDHPLLSSPETENAYRYRSMRSQFRR